jgi:hypothetical protein
LVEGISKSEVSERGRKFVNWEVENTPVGEREMCEGRGKFINWEVEKSAKYKMGERGWECINWFIEKLTKCETCK